eukprot:6206078-Pleurochrysis_carterae.AAC.2
MHESTDDTISLATTRSPHASARALSTRDRSSRISVLSRHKQRAPSFGGRGTARACTSLALSSRIRLSCAALSALAASRTSRSSLSIALLRSSRTVARALAAAAAIAASATSLSRCLARSASALVSASATATCLRALSSAASATRSSRFASSSCSLACAAD